MRSGGSSAGPRPSPPFPRPRLQAAEARAGALLISKGEKARGRRGSLGGPRRRRRAGRRAPFGTHAFESRRCPRSRDSAGEPRAPSSPSIFHALAGPIDRDGLAIACARATRIASCGGSFSRTRFTSTRCCQRSPVVSSRLKRCDEPRRDRIARRAHCDRARVTLERRSPTESSALASVKSVRSRRRHGTAV